MHYYKIGGSGHFRLVSFNVFDEGAKKPVCKTVNLFLVSPDAMISYYLAIYQDENLVYCQSRLKILLNTK